ncbi:hypothetical protein [Prosthecobacter sp.]|jgi:hypothetical protein|uniref:hypothetical protein n=1 Tax=Prosthecobacter sp. TaxID=1965333 RepID=UPI003783C93D
MPTDAPDITRVLQSALAMPAHWREEMDARVQHRESGESPSHTHEEVMAELNAVTA